MPSELHGCVGRINAFRDSRQTREGKSEAGNQPAVINALLLQWDPASTACKTSDGGVLSNCGVGSINSRAIGISNMLFRLY